MMGISKEFMDSWYETEILIEAPPSERCLIENNEEVPSTHRRSKRLNHIKSSQKKSRKAIKASSASSSSLKRVTRSTDALLSSEPSIKLRKLKDSNKKDNRNVQNETPIVIHQEEITSSLQPTKRSMVCLSRRETFSAAHRLHNPDLSAAENRALYDKCNNENGHGHNYEVKVTLRGPIDSKTGMVYNLADLKMDMKSILDHLDHKNLDKEVKFFKKNVSSVENIAYFFLHALKKRMSKPELLYKVKVKETENNSASITC
ncbi:6-pyruvoyl tetrahydrobiopterin synthase [Aphelenchoides besseyi]|nr:6-pyruvoyl tetrahydrobiopterin synthase [Aphelenchoides besseyi]KAI6207842.1 6-pyruvoyl tetrahydrobiopterin synthase [Aphelenchoides besseyi]